RLDLDGGRRVVPDPGVLDLERDDHAVALEVDSGDLADLHAGDAHLVGGFETCGLTELGLVGRACPDDGQFVEKEGGQCPQQHHDDAQGTGGGRTATFAHRPCNSCIPSCEQRFAAFV